MEYTWLPHDLISESDLRWAHEYFRMLQKTKRHLNFRRWLVQNDYLCFGARITSYKPEYVCRWYRQYIEELSYR